MSTPLKLADHTGIAATAADTSAQTPAAPIPTPVAEPAMLLSKSDLARELGVSAKTIDRMDQTGKLPRSVGIGARKRWYRPRIVEWISAGCPDRKTFEASRRSR